jgi:hypothetical protein
MNAKTWLGLLMLAASYLPLLAPRRLFSDPDVFFYGYTIVPGNVLGGAAALSALGLILVSEGVCERLGAPALSGLLLGRRSDLARAFAAAATAGLAMELLAQWLGKLWFYPYWTMWFYGLVVIPGFAFYWAAIVDSYLAVKAALDATAGPALGRSRRRPARGAQGVERDSQPPRQMGRFPVTLAGVLGAVMLGIAAWGYLAWYTQRGGYVFAVTEPVRGAPPFAYVLLAFVGGLLAVEWALHDRGLPSLIGSLRQAYWVPLFSLAISSVVTSLLIESQNRVNHFWAYAHFPEPDRTFMGVPLAVFAAWPWQYLAFLLIASLFGPGLANLFWRAPSDRPAVGRAHPPSVC